MSLKGDKYETTEEVKFRLEQTVVLYDKEPVYITRVNLPEMEDKGEIARVYFIPLPINLVAGNGKEVRKYLSSKNFDLAPFKMGYFNHKGEATFVSRNPIRQNRQGLCQNITSFTDCRGKPSQTMNFVTMVGSPGFIDMFNGKYPSFEEAGELLENKGTSSVAVSRSFAFIIDHDLEALLLMHKGIKCGIALKGDKVLKVPPKFHFLREEMEEHRIPIS